MLYAANLKNILCPPDLETKRVSEQITNVSPEGSFEGYASLFGLVDMGHDQVMPGAFRETLLKRGPGGIKMLWQHQAVEPIGSWRMVEEDGRGLKVAGRLNLNVARAREILALMRDGALDGLSIGFRTQKAVTDKITGVRSLLKLDLWEISIVTFPMLPQARVSAVKRACAPHQGQTRQVGLVAAIRQAAALLR